MSFFFNDTAPTEIYSLSLHDALPIYVAHDDPQPQSDLAPVDARRRTHVHEVSAVVAIQLGPEIGRAHVNSSHGYISYAVFCLKKKNPRLRPVRSHRRYLHGPFPQRIE